MKLWLALAMLLFSSLACADEELAIFAGQPRISHGETGTPGWSVAYSHDITDHLFGSVVYLNEGHFPGHHRDGFAAQAGLRTGDLGHGVYLQAALGPYNYFDTTLAENAQGYADAHGTGMLYSLAARWRQGDSAPWSWVFRVDRTQAPHGIDTTMFLVGASYRVSQDASFGQEGTPRGHAARDELTVSGGQTIVNSFESQNSSARSVDYRHSFNPVMRASLGWLHEGDARLVRRDGLVAQGWLEPTFYDGRFSLGIGFGPYIALDHYRSGPDVLGLLSTTLAYRLSPRWNARILWHRSVSRYDRDTDILLAGIGYRF